MTPDPEAPDPHLDLDELFENDDLSELDFELPAFFPEKEYDETGSLDLNIDDLDIDITIIDLEE